MRKSILISASLGMALLAGCADIDEMNAQAAAQQRAADQSRCAGYGFQPGTDPFANCMMQTQQHRDQTQMEQRREDALNQQRKQDQAAQQRAQDDQKAAADRAASEKHQAEIQQMMRSDQGFTPPMPQVGTPSGSHCTTTTTTTQTGNAGSSNSSTVCH